MTDHPTQSLPHRKEDLMHTTKRYFLIAGALAPLAAALAGTAKAAEPSCGADLSLSQKNRRRALGYADVSSDPKRRCSLCTYFTAGDGGCGGCQMQGGSSVNASGTCNFFVAKPG
jgi:hypothetical protein